MEKISLKTLISRNIILGIEKKERILQQMVDTNTEDKLFQLVYSKYPVLNKDWIKDFLEMLINFARPEDVEHWGSRQFEEFAELIAGTAIDFFSGYSEIAGVG